MADPFIAKELSQEEKEVDVVDKHTEITSRASDESYLRQQIGKDEVLVRKMILVNKAINDIGWTNYHLKLFFLNGFGYAVDSLLIVCQSIAQSQVRLEFAHRGVTKLYAVSFSSSIGLLAGALFWGLGGDVIGRKVAFNTSLFFCALFVLLAGAMPTYVSFCAMVALYSAGAGGNYAIDATNFLEFLPSKQAFLTTILAVWWGVGYTITGFLAWAFMSNWSCDSADDCTWQNNKGWRLLHFTAGSIVLVMAFARVLLFRIQHSPKWLITDGKDAEAVEVLRSIAVRYNRPFNLTVEQLQAEGDINGIHDSKWASFTKHSKGLFASRKQTWATLLLFFLWILIGIANPLYRTFLPYYLSTRGYSYSPPQSIVWRNYAINQICGAIGPLLAWPLLDTPHIRRRGTLAIGAFLTMIFLFGYTQVTTGTQNVALSCVINAVENIFFGGLYGITPELIPTSSRATGYGIAVAINRVCNIIANLIGTYANVETVAPLFVCAGLFGGLVIVSVLLPFEPSGKQIG